MNALETRALTKHYGTLTALKSASLSVQAGQIFGLLGPNGAGKTTLISILTGLEQASGGSAFIFGHPVNRQSTEIKRLLGIVPQELISHGFFSVEEVLEFHSGYYGIRNNREYIHFLLERLGLFPQRDKRVRQLSGGMKRRLLIAKALVHKPRLLLLDEPTAGVDIDLRQSLWTFIRELNQEGTSVLLTTHYLEEAEALCNQVAFIHHGEILKTGETQRLIRELTCREVTLSVAQKAGAESTPLRFALGYGDHVGRAIEKANLNLDQIQDIHIHEGRLESAFRQVIMKEVRP